MLVFNSDQVRELAPMPLAIERLRQAFGDEYHAPARQVLPVPGGDGRFLFSMPAFTSEGVAAIKLVTLFPDNGARDLPTIQGVVVLLSDSGAPVAVMDGGAVTRLRTAAASALASSYLSRQDSAHLVLIGAGSLTRSLVEAHSAVRPILKVSLFGRETSDAEEKAEELRPHFPEIEIVAPGSKADAVGQADIVTCATNSGVPVLEGRWLRPGTHIDLIGSFSPARRETDDDVVTQSRIFVDTLEGAMTEAGDLLDPLSRGVISRNRIEGELTDLIAGRASGRRIDDEITLFKSVGTAIEDLATAQLVVERA